MSTPYTEVAPAADEYAGFQTETPEVRHPPETPCPPSRLKDGLKPSALRGFNKAAQSGQMPIPPVSVRREADDLADFELIGRKLSNVNLGEVRFADALNETKCEDVMIYYNHVL